MGTLTGTELEDEVRYNLGGRTDLDSRLYRFLNFAQTAICRQHDFEELEQLTDDTIFTASTSTYTLTARPRRIHSVRLIDGALSRKLKYVPHRLWDDFIASPAAYTTARTSFYTIWQNKLEWFRIPDDNYNGKIRWSKWATDFAASSSLTSDLENKDDIIIAFATAWAFRSLGEQDKMLWWGNIGWNLLKQAINISRTDPDREILPVGEIKSVIGEYWNDPFVRSMR
jgi:hypothetical protein